MEAVTISTAKSLMLPTALLLLAAGSAAGQTPAVQQQLELSAESEPVLTMGDVVITHAELDAHMQRLPQDDRADAVSDMERVEQLLQSLLLKKALYEAARDNGLLQDPVVTMRALYATADVLADEQMGRRIASRMLDSYEQQARELYLSDPDRFRPGPDYSFTHVLVSTGNRSEAEAMGRILEVHEKVQQGAELDTLVSEYSEDSASAERGGAYREISLDTLDRNFSRALSELGSPGAVTGPVRSRFGWHVIRLDERHEAPVPEWEEAREEAIEMARKQHEGRIREAYIEELLDPDAIEVVPGSIERFQKRHGYDPAAGRAGTGG